MAHQRRGLVAAAIALALPLAAAAQGTGGTDPTARDEEQRFGVEHKEHITALRSQLQITPAETASWDAFAAVMRQNASEISAKLAQRTAGFEKMSAVDDLKSYADVTALHAQESQRLIAPFEVLYGALSPEQKQRADQLFHQSGPRHGPLHG